MQAADGKLSAQCFHDGCSGRGWQEFKDKIGKPSAEHYDPPLEPQRQQSKSKEQRMSPWPNASPSDDGDVVLDEADHDPHRLAAGYLQRFL
jgi:hypothetical protein